MTGAAARAALERVRRFVEDRLGLRFEDDRLAELAQVVDDRVSALGLEHAGIYADALLAPASARDELRALAERLTVGETYFFRHGEQFEAMAEVAIPERLRALGPFRRLRLLSAGCASGEEAYTLAMLVRERLPGRSACQADVQGVDINAAALSKAARGAYSTWSLRETPAAIRGRYFRADGQTHVLDPCIRSAVTFTEGNLLDPDPRDLPPGAFDIVFCRNVLIYFGDGAIRTAVAHLTELLAPGGFLFLGHAENLRGLSNRFHLHHTHGTFYYRKIASGDVLAPVARPAAEPHLDLPDGTWVEAIQRATDRVAALAGTAPPARPAARAAGRPAWDRAAIMNLLEQERFGEASAALAALPAEAAEDLDAQLLAAVLHANRRELELARRVCERILERDDLNAGAHYLLALCCEQSGDMAGAVHHDQISAHLDPTFAMPRFHMGLMARRAGDTQQASAELGAALRLFEREEGARILMFGGGFSREALVRLCAAVVRT